MNLLDIKKLHASFGKKEIIKGLNLTIKPGETHIIMGPNGSGKSTLAQILAGRPGYKVTAGTVSYQGKNLLELNPEERARAGIFMAFQYPVEIPGLSTVEFLKTSLNEIRNHRGEKSLDPLSFLKLVQKKLKPLGLNETILGRSVNNNFSGGEKKLNEILQLILLEPELAILDETDSGLDVDTLKTVAKTVNKRHSPDKATIVVTHYANLLNHIKTDFVHILYQGKIVLSGGLELAKKIEKQGYKNLTKI